MTPRSSSRRSSSSRHGEARRSVRSGGLAALLTTFLLAVILMTGPLILGAARLWIELPLLAAVALLLMLQGVRLTFPLPEGVTRRVDAIDLSVVLFVLYTIARWLTSPTEYFSRIEAMDIVAYAGVFFTCRYGMVSRKYGVALLFSLVILGVGETGFGYYLKRFSDPDNPAAQWFPFGPTEQLQLHYFPRWLGTYGCPNHYASLLVMAVGAALALASFSKLAWPLRIFLFYVAAIMMIGVMESASRGSWLALAASICALMIFGMRHGTMRWWVPLTTGVLLLAALGYGFSRSPDVQARVVEAIDTVRSGNLDTYVRFQLAEDGLHIARDHPLFGTGPGTFVFIHPRYQSSTFAFKAVLAHDDYLNCLDDYGLAGFALALFFVAAVTLKFSRPLWVDQRWQDRVLVATGFAAWAALLVHSWLDFNLHIPANALLFFALTGLAVGRLKDEELRSWSTLSLARLGPWLGRGVILLSLVYGLEVARTAASDIIYERAFASADEVPISESIQGAETALQYDPGNAQALVFLGDLHRYKASRQRDIEGRISEGQKALDAYQEALQANALDDTVEARQGMTYDVMRRYPEAFFCYKQAVTAQPYNGQFWYWLGNHYWERDMLAKAEQAYLVAQCCPHGGGDAVEAEKELRAMPEMFNVPLPTPHANPLVPQTEPEGPAAVP